MDLQWSAADAAFRDEVRNFLDEKLTPELRTAGRLMTSVYADHAATSLIDGPPALGTGRSRNWAWPPDRYGAVTMRRAIRVAWAAPWSRRTRCRQRSMPAATPALVRTCPSST